MIQTGTVICAALGIDTDLTLIYQLFAFLLVLSIASRVALVWQRPHVTVRRHLPRYATAGEPFTYHVELVNQGDRIERDLRVIDTPVVIPPDIEHYLSVREPFEETRNRWDRFVGFHRFIWLQRLLTGIVIEPADAADVPVRGGVNVTISATPQRRGTVALEATVVMHPDPVGMNYAVTRIPNYEEVLILPRRYPVTRRFRLGGANKLETGRGDATIVHGESDEFVSLRDYRPGDPVKKIHWSSTARRGRPVVREYQDECFVRQAVVLDTAMAAGDAFETAVSVAASFVAALDEPETLLDLVYVTPEGPRLVSSDRSGSGRQLAALATAKPLAETEDNLATVLSREVSHLSGCILVLGSWNDERKALVDGLRRRGLACAIFLVSAAPTDPPAADVRVITPETIADVLASLGADRS